MVNKISSIACMSLFCCTASIAQSIMSVHYPAGLPLAHATGPSLAIAGSGVGVENDFFGMADNVGNLGGITRAVFAAVVSFDFSSINEENDATNAFALSPRLLSLAVPLGVLGTFGFSLDRRSSMNYKYRTAKTIEFPTGEADSADFGIGRYGGFTAWQAGWGYRVGRFVRAGFSYERVYLSSNEITMMRGVSTPGEGSLESTLYDSAMINFRGNGLRAGVLYSRKQLTVGCAAEYLFPGDAALKQDGPHVGNEPAASFSLHLPPSVSAGVSYAVSPELLTAASCTYTIWRNFYSGITLSKPVRDALTFSSGVQFIPAPNLLVPRYWEIMQYRAGFRYSQLPAAGAAELALTLSLGLPIQRGGGLVDLILDIGRRYDSNYKGYSENFLQVMVGLNGGRKWSTGTGTRY